MVEISQSGLHQDELGQPILVTQGLSGYTLVDKKNILFRLFVYPPFLSRVTAVRVKIKYIGENIPDTHILVPFSDLLIENLIPNGPSVGIIFKGNIFPDASIRYQMQFIILGEQGILLGVFLINEVKFEKSGRLRILAKTIQTITRSAPWGNQIQSDIFWLADLVESMIRFAAMLPVSDGVFLGTNPGPDDGLAYIIGENIDGWPEICPKGAPASAPDKEFPNFLVCPDDEIREANLQEAKFWNSQGVRVDVTLAWRHRDLMKPPDGERASGSATYNASPQNRYATVIGGLQNGFEKTAAAIAQEVAHTFGTVAGTSPYTDGGGHSILVDILDPFAFDFVRLRTYYPSTAGPVGDVMGIAWGRGRDLTLFNEYDWEYLRQKLVQISALTPRIKGKSERKKKLVKELQRTFAGLQKIQMKNPKSVLYSKPGFEWNWTSIGFRCLKAKAKEDGSGLAPSAAKILSVLREQGTKEIYVPIDEKPLTVVINRSPPMTCDLVGKDSMHL